MSSLVTLKQVNDRLGLDMAEAQDGSFSDIRVPDLELMMDQATNIVMGYVTEQPSPEWDETTVPGSISAAILMVIKSLFDDPENGELLKGLAEWDIKNPIVAMLKPYRMPTCA